MPDKSGSSTSRSTTEEDQPAADLTRGQFLADIREHGLDVYCVVESSIAYGDDGDPHGEATFDILDPGDGDDQITLDATTVHERLLQDNLLFVSDRAWREPTAVIAEFGRHNIAALAENRLYQPAGSGPSVAGIDTHADLIAACIIGSSSTHQLDTAPSTPDELGKLPFIDIISQPAVPTQAGYDPDAGLASHLQTDLKQYSGRFNLVVESDTAAAIVVATLMYHLDADIAVDSIPLIAPSDSEPWAYLLEITEILNDGEDGRTVPAWSTVPTILALNPPADAHWFYAAAIATADLES